MNLRIVKIGNSSAVILPKKLLEAMNGVGKKTVQANINVRFKKTELDFGVKEADESIVDKEVYTVAKNLLARYHEAFVELSQK